MKFEFLDNDNKPPARIASPVGRYGKLTCEFSRQAHLRRGVDVELQLGLLAVVDGEPLHQQRREAGARAAAEGVEDQEALGEENK